MKNTLLTIWNFYLEGFRSMTLGRTLWLIILVKLFIMFFILKIFFFPDFLGDHPTDADKGTKIQWYMAVIANWALDQSISEVSILSIIILCIFVLITNYRVRL